MLVIHVSAVPPVESVTLIVNEKEPAVVGVPVIAPVVALRVRPGGSEPDATENLYGKVPPVAMTVEEYGTPTSPVVPGGQATVRGAGEMVMPQLLVVAVVPFPESVTFMVKEKTA